MIGLALDLDFEVHEHASEPGVLVVSRDLAQTRSLRAPVLRPGNRLPLPAL